MYFPFGDLVCFVVFLSWWNGEDIEVRILHKGTYYDHGLGRNRNYCFVEDELCRRWYVYRYLGSVGDKVVVNTWDLKK